MTLLTAALGLLFGAVTRSQYVLNREAAQRAVALADAIGFARRAPHIYALPNDDDPVATAERCAVMEAAARFQLSENAVRNLVFLADEASARLPQLWECAREGLATLAQVESAIDLLPRFTADSVKAVAAFDAKLAAIAGELTSGAFRSRARRLAERLAPSDPATEHARAREERTVCLQPEQAGMAWVHLLTDAAEARAIFRRLTSTAKHTSRRDRAGRTRDQIRADIATAWLRGTGTPTAAKVKVFATVPLDVLSPAAQASVRRDLPVPDGAPDLNECPRLDTGEPVDRVTAVRMLLEAGKFTRVVTDPVTGVALDMDRRFRAATRQQREWLLLVHGTCTRDGCRHPAADTDVDHWDAFHGSTRGPTEIGNLHPFCSAENQFKEKSRFRYRRRKDGTVQLISPTGFGTTAPAREETRAAQEFLRRLRAEPTPARYPAVLTVRGLAGVGQRPSGVAGQGSQFPSALAAATESSVARARASTSGGTSSARDWPLRWLPPSSARRR